MSTEELKKELVQMTDEFCQEGHVCRAEGSAVYKDLEAKLKEVQQLMDEQRARGQPRQMVNAQDVSELLGVSRSTAYSIIRKLNQELANNDYITVRGKVSRAYFERRVFGIDAS